MVKNLLVNLMQKPMRLFFLVTHFKVNHIEFSIEELYVWKNLFMLCVDQTNSIV